MRHSTARIGFRFLFPVILVLSIYGVGRPQTAAPQSQRREPPRLRALLRHAIPGTRDLPLIVELTDPAVLPMMKAQATDGGATVAAAGQGRGRVRLDTAEATAYRAQLARIHTQMSEKLRTLKGVQVLGSTDLVMNAMFVRAPVEQYEAIRQLPGVKKVYFSRLFHKNLNSAKDVVNATALWARVNGGRAGAGQGVNIGLIDTGIDITNPMFIDTATPLPSGFPKYDTRADANFTNHKVIVARNYVFPQYFYASQSVNNASDEDGHGSFVAGCAAGKVVTAPDANVGQISGMAPAAFLGSYKVFGTPGINDGATTAGIMAAVNDAVSDGMDVLNLSLGSLDYVPPEEDPEVTVINNAAAAGVVVVLAAGNEGPDTHTVGSPGGASDAITVGAVWNSRALGPQLQVTGPGAVPANLQNVSYVNGSGPAITSTISAPVLDVASLDGTGLACSALPSGSLSGKIALIERGQCPFTTKVTNAANSGARAVIAYDNMLADPPFSMGGLTGIATPAVMIANLDAINLKSFLAANSSATVSIAPSGAEAAVPTTPAILASFSSRGPSADFGMKPDLTAVGVNVYSATQHLYANQGIYDASRFTQADGTSFSTPMVSGAAAAILGLFQGLALTPAAVKSLLVNTASQTVTIDGIAPASIVQSGSGLLNMGNAATAGAVFSPTSLNFGVKEYSGTASLTQTVAIRNVSGNTDQYGISVRPVVDGARISLSTANTGPVADGAVANVDVTIQAAAPLTGGFQGYVMVQSAQTSATYAIPYWAGLYVPDPTRILTVSQSASGTNVFRNLKDALAAANPGNIIEFADSQTYELPSSSDATTLPSVVVSTNAQGLPLHGITIRAAAGQSPVLDASNTSALSDIQVVGLRDVLIQGLTINGGDIGVELWQPSASVPLSVAIDHCNITNQAGSTTSTGVFIENGGDVDITKTTISGIGGSSGSGVFVVGGARLTMSGSTVQGNASDGIDAVDSNLDLIGSTFTGNLGAGASLDTCSGTIAGDTFSNNTDPSTGDGLDIYDGSVTVTDNNFNGNGSAGLYLDTAAGARGPTGLIEGNTFQSNAEYGIQDSRSQNMPITANFIAESGVGFVASGSTTTILTNNIIFGSVTPSNPPAGTNDPAWGNGVYVDGSGSISLVNNTIYGNQLHGIEVAPGSSAVVSVQNTILSHNATGDVFNLSAASILYSFISDGSITGSTNRSGDPGFTNPAGNDFSLAAGSAAIDAGNNAAPNLPFLDFNQRMRVAGAGDPPGVGTVDMGAIEAGSSYPITYPLVVSGPVNGTQTALDNNSFTTGFAVVDPSISTPSQVTFAAFDPSGIPFALPGSTNTQIIAAEAQEPILDFQLFNFRQGTSKLGAALASSVQKLVGFFLIFDPSFAHLADGVDVSADTYTDFVFVRHESDPSGQATYQLFNPGVNPAHITAIAYDASGNPLESPKLYTIPPKGQYLFTFDATQTSNGHISVHSDYPITGLETFGNATDVAALRATPAGTETRLFFPHFAVNQGFSSLIGVVNSGGVTANLTLKAYGNDGSILGTPAQRSINANGQLSESASSLFGLGLGDSITGYIVVDSDQPGVTGFSAFNYANGSIQSNAAVPSESVPQPVLLFSDIANQVPSGVQGDDYLTGIALLNPYGTAVSYRLKVFDGSGNEMAEMTDTLGPHQKVAKFLSWPTPGAGFFTQTIQLGSGHIEVTALDPTTLAPGYQLLGFELFFTQSMSQLAAVMAQFPH